jgi:hypothetical protein
MKKIFVLAIMAILASCTPAKKTDAVDSAVVVLDTLAVQPGVEGTVPVDSVK